MLWFVFESAFVKITYYHLGNVCLSQSYQVKVMLKKWILKDDKNYLLKKIILNEVRFKRKLDQCYNDNILYENKRVSIIINIIFILTIPFCYLHLYFVSKRKNFYINIVKTELTEAIYSNLEKTYKADRYNQVKGKLFILPLRIFSHLIRKEWKFNSALGKRILRRALEKYIIIFVKKMESKNFYLREDYYGESSLLCSIKECKRPIKVISFQHGAADLGSISNCGMYPGQRASIQITHDIYTYNTYSRINNSNSKICLSKPNFKSVTSLPLEKNVIYFIGNGNAKVYNEFEKISKKIKTLREGIKIYYKPHPSERRCRSDFMNIEESLDCFYLLSRKTRNIYIGQNSTFLYDAIMSGHLVYVLDQLKFPSMDSIKLLRKLPELKNDKIEEFIRDIDRAVEFPSYEIESLGRTVHELIIEIDSLILMKN